MSAHAEHRARLIWWVRTAITVVAFGFLTFATVHVLRSYSVEEIGEGLTSLPAWVVAVSIALFGVQQLLFAIRERLAIQYAGRGELGLARPAAMSLVTRLLSPLGFSALTGLALRLRHYARWGVSPGDVARVTMYNALVYCAGIASMCAFTFGLLPIPPAVAERVPVVALRAIAAVGALLLVGLAVWCARGPRALRIRGVELPVPDGPQIAGAVFLPVGDLALTAVIVHLCLPAGLGLDYFEVVVVCLISQLAASLFQIPAGLGVLEGFVILIAGAPASATPVVIGALLGRRIIVNLGSIAAGGLLLAALELLRGRQREVEPSALVRRALDPDPPLVRLDDPLRNEQA